MKYEDIVALGNKIPVIETKMLLRGGRGIKYAKVQISRLVKSGKLIQIKRGLYILPAAFRKIQVFEPFLANIIKKPSYLSLEKALEYHGLIPEAVPVYTSVTTKRPGKFRSDVGVFSYRHLNPGYFWGYTPVTINKQTALIALPEKALLDLFYLKREKITHKYIEEMRLQNTGGINIKRLKSFALRTGRKNIIAAAAILIKHIKKTATGEKKL